jgi:hypothetical protein
MKRFAAEVNREEAHRIVGLLARGVDPDKPDQVAPTNVLERPAVIRALFLAVEALSADDKVPSKEVRTGKPWSKDEDDELRFAVSQNDTLNVIASRHQRSEGGIVARMVRLGIVEDKNAARAFFRHLK